MKKLNEWIEKHERGFFILVWSVIFFMLVFLLSSCSSPRQDQYLANARAGALAIKAPNLTPVQRESIADGLESYLLNATDDMPLPQPEMQPAVIVANPAGYAEAAKESPPAEGFSGWLIGAAVASAAAAFPLLRAIPGLGGLFTQVANLAFAALAPKSARERDKAAHDAYDDATKTDRPASEEKA